MKYNVTVIYDASVTVTVEADSPEEAKAKAMEEASSVSLCHQCSRHLDVGDAIEAVHPYADSPEGEPDGQR